MGHLALKGQEDGVDDADVGERATDQPQVPVAQHFVRHVRVPRPEPPAARVDGVRALERERC